MSTQFIRNLPIRRKLMLVLLLASLITLLLAAASVFAFQWRQSRQQIVRDLSTQAEIIAANSTAAISFRDHAAAREILASLRAKPHLLCARIHLPDGEVLAEFVAEQQRHEFAPATLADTVQFEGPYLILIQSVELGEKRIGFLYLRFDFEKMQREILTPYLAILAVILAASALVAILLSSGLQRLISLPILRLTETARVVAERQDYSVRAPELGRDELGTLTTAFNQMLGRIQQQDVALRDSEGRYRLLFERNPIPMFVYDANSLAFLAVNVAAITHYGYSGEEFLRMTVRDIHPPEDIPAVQARLESATVDGVRVWDWRHRKKDGSIIEVESTSHYIQFMGRRARLVLALDVTLRNQAEAALEHRFLIEKLISEISTNFINLAPGEIAGGIDRALRVIGQFAGADRAFVFRFSANADTITVLNLWCAEGIQAPMQKAHSAPAEPLPWWMDRLRRAETIHISSMADLPLEAAAEKKFFERLGIQSLLAVPMIFRGQLTGFVCFDAVRSRKIWSDDEITLLRLASQIFTNALERERAQDELETLHRRMVEISRKTGMAEIATGVLHNVGNVLNSVNVSANLLSEHLGQSRLNNVSRLADLLKEHEHDLASFLATDARGRQVPAYFQKLARHLEQEQQFLATEFRQLSTNIEHIKQIVSMQQNYAQVAGIKESLPVAAMVEDALHLTEPGCTRRGIAVLREFQSVPPVLVDKHKILQILVNLIRNARQAVDAAHGARKTIRVRIRRQSEAAVCIQVQDDGIGIAPESLTRIFTYGYTTKSEGHGFGLHQSALCAKEMGGSLQVESDGVGKGATFTLELRLAAQPDDPGASNGAD